MSISGIHPHLAYSFSSYPVFPSNFHVYTANVFRPDIPPHAGEMQEILKHCIDKPCQSFSLTSYLALTKAMHMVPAHI